MIKVAVAIIVDSKQQVLITQRPLNTSHGGHWEFPGGKLEANELPQHALVREIREEIGLEVLQYQFLGEVIHHYPHRSVQLLVFLVTEFMGKPSCVEGQLDMKWVSLDEINPEDFPEANRQVMQLIPDLACI